jgi:hypothetical protein
LGDADDAWQGASLFFGLVWNAYGTTAAFGLGAALALVASMLLSAGLPRAESSVGHAGLL